MIKNNWIVPVLIVVGFGLIILSIFAPQTRLQLGYSKKKLAFIAEKSGTVKIQNTEMALAEEVNLNDILDSRDLIRTDGSSETLIEFQTGGQFRVVEKSEVLVDRLDNGTPIVVIRSGEIFIERFGKAPSFWVRKEGQIYTAVDYALIDKKNSSRLQEPLPDQQNKEQISQMEIETILNSKKNDFFKCFGQLIQKNPLASGQVLISFTIEKLGNTSKVEVSKSDINDISFKSCLTEVVARIHFRAFNGSPITTVFPLKFE